MSRRNRRRTRGGHRNPNFQTNSFELPSIAESPASQPSGAQLRLRRNDLSARHWHNRYLAWQARERRQDEEREKLRQEQRRIFGGDSQDGEEEDGLCTVMLEHAHTPRGSRRKRYNSQQFPASSARCSAGGRSKVRERGTHGMV
ncbi:MAG: hypothetical protein Q9163_001290 [Psora crenata]